MALLTARWRLCVCLVRRVAPDQFDMSITVLGSGSLNRMNQFNTKAQVPIDQTTLYVQRRYDKQFDDYLVRNDYITVIGPRCSGKTSLLARKFHDLRGRQRYLPVYVNL